MMDSEVIERPNTRRSHVRSRGVDELAPGTGLEAVPAAATTTTTKVDPTSTVPRPLEPTAPATAAAGSVKTLYVRPAPLVSQQRPLYGGHQGQSQGTGTTTTTTTSSAVPPATATARLQAPDVPRTSGFGGGRSGRNISSSSVAVNPAVIQTGRYAAGMTTTTTKGNSSTIDHLRKPNPPVAAAATEVMKPTQ